MRMGGGCVAVPMGMPSAWDNGLVNDVAVESVVGAMGVRVAVRQRLVRVRVFVPLGPGAGQCPSSSVGRRPTTAR